MGLSNTPTMTSDLYIVYDLPQVQILMLVFQFAELDSVGRVFMLICIETVRFYNWCYILYPVLRICSRASFVAFVVGCVEVTHTHNVMYMYIVHVSAHVQCMSVLFCSFALLAVNVKGPF